MLNEVNVAYLTCDSSTLITRFSVPLHIRPEKQKMAVFWPVYPA